MASKVSEFIGNHPVFTTRELIDACGDDQNTRNLLHLAKDSGRVRKVRRGLYVSSVGRYEGARLGWVLERRRERWRVAHDVLARLRRVVGRGPYHFGSVRKGSPFDPTWRLIMQEDEETMEGWLNG